MSWHWFARTVERPDEAIAAAALSSGGYLAAFPSGGPAPRGERKVDARAIDPDGAPALASLVLPPDGVTILFDDPAVGGALRAALAAPWPDVLSTLVVESSRFAGALTAVRDGNRGRLGSDPFARLFPAELVEVGPGLLGSTPAPTGPVIQRYGGGNPWPWDTFD
ncbi:MAG: hypothetical protein ABIR67_02055 [Gaiellaceae bacterium]